METRGEIAADIFKKGFACSQAVLASHCEDFGLAPDLAKKISCGFGGGMGHSDSTCGAVSGAIMLIGLKYGKYEEADTESKARTYELVKKYTDNFKKEFGSINCSELLKYDLSNAKELAKAKNSGIFTDLCPVLVKRSVELAEKILKG